MEEKRKGFFIVTDEGEFKVIGNQIFKFGVAVIRVTHVVNYSPLNMYIDFIPEKKYIPLVKIISITEY